MPRNPLVSFAEIHTLLANHLQKQEKLLVAVSAWYKKEKPTFSDAMAAARKFLWNEINFSTSTKTDQMIKMPKPWLQHLQHVLAYAP